MIPLFRKFLPALLCFLAAPCIADEFQLGIDQELLALTNAYRAQGESDGLADGIYRIAPEGRISGDNDLFAYEAYYNPVYSRYIRASGRSGFDHFLGAAVDMSVTPVDRVNINFRFQDIRGNRTNLFFDEAGGTEIFNSDIACNSI